MRDFIYVINGYIANLGIPFKHKTYSIDYYCCSDAFIVYMIRDEITLLL